VLRLLALVALIPGHTQAPSFSQTVLRDFDSWDINRDGALGEDEIGRAALSPAYHGEDAAALAALHIWLSSKEGEAPRLTKAWFASYVPVRLRLPKGISPEEAKKARKEYATTPASLQSTFVSGVRRLSKSRSADLFLNGGPALSDIRQGALGDCYMLAPLGALVNRNPNDVQHMIVPNGEGYRVEFADGKTVQVSSLTDTELAMGGSNTSRGMWVRVLEKAFGSRDIAEDSAGDKLARDTMRGGQTGTAGRKFTGRKFTNLALIGGYQKPVADADLKSRLVKLRAELQATLADHRIVLAGTPKTGLPKSVNGNHAYAVFAYDPSADRITLWNPHGNDFKPKGPEGFENGYARVGGVFSMPLETFARSFSRIFFEGKESASAN